MKGFETFSVAVIVFKEATPSFAASSDYKPSEGATHFPMVVTSDLLTPDGRTFMMSVTRSVSRARIRGQQGRKRARVGDSGRRCETDCEGGTKTRRD